MTEAVVDPERQAMAQRLLWQRGALRYLTRQHGQRRLYDLVHARRRERPDELVTSVFNCHRRLGKSTLGLFLLLEVALGAPDMLTKFCAPTVRQANYIVRPLVRRILARAPEEIEAKPAGDAWRIANPVGWGTAGAWPWGNPRDVSELLLVGLDADRGERARGGRNDAVVMDEVRGLRVGDLEYIVRDILTPQFVGTRNPFLLIVTSPPDSMGHDFVQVFKPRAEERETYCVIPASENPDWTAEDEKICLSEIGSKESPAWRREIECELISNPEHLITPEFVQKKETIVCEERKRPRWYIPWVVIDGAYRRDKLAAVFCYVDFESQLLVFEDSFAVRERTTKEIADLIRRKEHELWDDAPRDIRRAADMTEQQLADLEETHKLPIIPVDTHDADASLARFRTALQTGRVRILTGGGRNKLLLHSLEHGVWNRNHTDFERSADVGHWDLGKAAVYAWRTVNLGENPRPDDDYVRYDEATESLPESYGARKRIPERARRWARAFNREDVE